MPDNKYIDKIKTFIKQYKGILLFFVAMFAANIFWKLCVHGDENSDYVLIFNKIDVSVIYNFASRHVAKMTYLCIHLFDKSLLLINDIRLTYPNGHSIFIIWGCTGIKQMFIFLCIMLCASGSWKNKLWFIPLGLVLCYLINIGRISAITMIIKHHPELFKLMHLYIFKYLYYFLIFLIWVAWEEKFKNLKIFK